MYFTGQTSIITPNLALRHGYLSTHTHYLCAAEKLLKSCYVRQTLQLTFHSRFIKDWTQVVLECLSLAFGGAGAVRQQIETNVRIRGVVRVTHNQVPIHSHTLSCKLPHTHTFITHGGPKNLTAFSFSQIQQMYHCSCVMFTEDAMYTLAAPNYVMLQNFSRKNGRKLKNKQNLARFRL